MAWRWGWDGTLCSNPFRLRGPRFKVSPLFSWGPRFWVQDARSHLKEKNISKEGKREERTKIPKPRATSVLCDPVRGACMPSHNTYKLGCLSFLLRFSEMGKKFTLHCESVGL